MAEDHANCDNQVSGAEEDEKMSIAKFISLSYVISPVICFTVVGALKATLAITK